MRVTITDGTTTVSEATFTLQYAQQGDPACGVCTSATVVMNVR